MNPRTLELLEFDKIRQLLSEETSFGAGRDAALALEPSTDPETVKRSLEETGEARFLLDRGLSVPLGGLRDFRAMLDSALSGSLLEPAELLDIAQTCENSAALKRFLVARGEDCPTLRAVAEDIGSFPGVIGAIRRAITERAEVADSASHKLHQIRSSQRSTLARLREKLEALIHSAEYQKVLQDPIITLREDRYVVPVRSEHKDSLPGVVHDRSASGVTLFVEPMVAVPLNNELRELSLQERDEIARILRELTDTVLAVAPELRRTLAALGHLDLCFAKGRLSGRLDAVGPILVEEGKLDFRAARHPLLRLEPPARVVPIDVRLGGDFDTMVITGPNTGGKTVTLKTVGLLTLMAMAGLHVPAAEGSMVSVFRGVWADIGDEQSIEQNLSTFSSHLQNIIGIIRKVGGEADSPGHGHLVLLDEIGAGTDPVEGSALAMALLDFFHRSGARTIATTHYSEIKAYVWSRERMVNASVEFNVETLAPTYRLIIGLPGRSNALEISERLGLPAEITERARSFLKPETHDIPSLIQRLEEERAMVSEELRSAREASRKAREMQEEQARKWANLRESEEKVLEKARTEAKDILRIARAEASAIVERLRETEARLSAIGTGKMATEPEEPRAPIEAIESRRRMDRLEQVTRDIISSAERRVLRPTPGGRVGGGRAPFGRPSGRSQGVTVAASEVKPGQTFYVAGLRHFGEVIEAPDEGGMVGVMVGSMRLTVHVSDLRVPGKGGVPDFRPRTQETSALVAAFGLPEEGRSSGGPGAGTGASLEKALSVSPEIMLRGLSVEEALGRLDKYLDDALLAGLPSVRVIHGRGLGILRQAVGEYLDEHPNVRSHYIAEQSQGGLGVTICLLGARKPGPEGGPGSGGSTGSGGLGGPGRATGCQLG